MSKGVRSLFVLIMLLCTAFLMIQCDDSSSVNTDGDDVIEDGDTSTGCTVCLDCTEGFSCVQGQCVADSSAIRCYTLQDCPLDYTCSISPDSVDGTGKCCMIEATDGDTDSDIPSTCSEDNDCKDTTKYFCVDHTCELRYPECPNGDQDCWPGQVCNTISGYCEDGSTDGDKDADLDAEPELEKEKEKEKEVEPESDVLQCDRSSDCPNNMVCGPGGKCVASCTETGCTLGTCNTLNGFCEFCEDPCPRGQCCNYNAEFWYCGSCCVPPCEEGQACQGGKCVTPTCPTCEPGYFCDETTGFVCVNGGTDGDGSTEGSRMSCLPANSHCVEGVDFCCSGTCLMGTCL